MEEAPIRTASTSARWASTARLGGPALVVGTAVAMLAWTWETWPDPLVDFGRELYVAWRIAEGEVLYRDLGYFNGPLSPYLNGAWMALVGPGIRWIVLLNLLVAIATGVLLHTLLVRIAGRGAATLALLVYVLLFTSIQLLTVANYNFLAPYSHEMTHGLALCLLALGAIARHRATGGRRWIGVAGLALGLAFLTKAEIFVAGAAGTGLALWFTLAERARSVGPSRAAGLGLLFGAAAALPVALAGLALSIRMPAHQAVHAVLGAWPHVLQRDVLGLDFYRRHVGLTHPGENLTWMLQGFGVYLAAVGLLLGIAHGVGRLRLPAPGVAAGAFVLAAAAAWVGLGRDVLLGVGRPLPLVVAAIGLGVGAAWWRLPRAHPRRSGVELALALCAFSLLLLGKMMLNARIFHYGFVLALPATLLTVAALWDWLPRVAVHPPARRLAWRAGLLGVIAVVVGVHLQVAALRKAPRSVPVGRGPDRFLTDPGSARLVGEVAETVQARLGGDASVAILPQGAMLNYLMRRTNPTGFVQILPPEVRLFGEDHILAAFRARPPDAIVWIEMDLSSFGTGQFGQGYARELGGWLESRYRPAARIRSRQPRAWLWLPVPVE